MLSFLSGRIDAAKQVLSRYDQQNPHTAGQLRRTVGGVLIADGLVGLENPFDNRNSRPGLLGSFAGVVLGVVFVVVGLFVVGTSAEVDTTTTGEITRVIESRSSDGDRVCSLEATFTVSETTYTASSSVSSDGNCRRLEGESIEVHYNSANPRENRVGMSASVVGLVFVAAGSLVGLVSLVTLAIRVASLVFGVILWRRGTAMIKAHPRTVDDSGVIDEARAALTALISRQQRGRTPTLPGFLGTSRAHSAPPAPPHDVEADAHFPAAAPHPSQQPHAARPPRPDTPTAPPASPSVPTPTFSGPRAQPPPGETLPTDPATDPATAEYPQWRPGPGPVPSWSRSIPTSPSPAPDSEVATTSPDARTETGELTDPQKAATPQEPATAPRESEIPAGWYKTGDGRHWRWHDGTSWTEQVRPVE